MLLKLLNSLFPLVMRDPEKAAVIAQDPIHRLWAFTRILLPKHHPDWSQATGDIKDIFGRFACVPVDLCYLQWCVLLIRMALCPRRVDQSAGPEATLAGTPFCPFVHGDEEMSKQFVDAIHNGHRLDKGVCSSVQQALGRWGWKFAEHPLWRHVSSLPPHRSIIRRLALVAGTLDLAPFGAVAYQSGDEFKTEIARWVAWYSTIRVECNLRDGRAVERISSLLASMGTEDSDPSDGECSNDESSDSSTCSDDDRNDSPDAPVTTGITDTPKVRRALKNVTEDVVVEGLMNNYKLLNIPKGDCVVCQCVEATVRNFWLRVMAGTCANESVHQFFRQMIHQTPMSADSLEVARSLAFAQSVSRSRYWRIPSACPFTGRTGGARNRASVLRRSQTALPRGSPAKQATGCDTSVHGPARWVGPHQLHNNIPEAGAHTHNAAFAHSG
jgi:hypothetical protein